MKILMIKCRNIVDVLLATPLLANLRHHYHGATIDFALNDYCVAMISNHPNVRQVFSYPMAQLRTMSLRKRIHREIANLRQILQNRYDLVINLTEVDRGLLIAALSKARQRLADGIQNVGKHSVIAGIDQDIFYETGFMESRGMTGIFEADVLNVVTEKVAQWG
jgi:ADP-heptose:LPS heptosyltransferase